MFCSAPFGILNLLFEPCFAFWGGFFGAFPDELRLAFLAIAIVGAYALGRRANRKNREIVDQSRRDLRRAQTVARELEKVSTMIRKQTAKHQTQVAKFKQRVSELSVCEHEEAWRELCHEAEDMLRPTLHLANQIASAYDAIRQQSGNLMSFTDVRTDPLTGMANRRALDDALQSQFAIMLRYNSSFTLAMFDIDHFKRINDSKGHLHGDRILQDVARLLDDCARETDTVARYGGEEFVVVMPHTNIEGATVFADRIREQVAEKMPVTISGGVTGVLEDDTAESILARADKALYEAKSAGRNCVFQYDGQNYQPAPAKKAEEEDSLATV